MEAHFPHGSSHLPTFLTMLELSVTLTDGSAVGLHSPAINVLVFFCNVSQLPHPQLSGLKREGHYPLARHFPLCCLLYPSTSEPRSSLHSYLMLHWVGTTLGGTSCLGAWPGLLGLGGRTQLRHRVYSAGSRIYKGMRPNKEPVWILVHPCSLRMALGQGLI